MCDAAGVESWSYVLNVGTGWQAIDQRKTNNVIKTITTQDNLDGSLSTLTYPSGRVGDLHAWRGWKAAGGRRQFQQLCEQRDLRSVWRADGDEQR